VSAFLAAFVAYLMGGIPTGVMVSRYLLGKDIREFGSQNPGAVNVWRVFGLKWGLLVVAVDVGKGYFAVKLLPQFVGDAAWIGFASFIGLLAVAGHIWSPFTQLRGGKGVGTAAGVALALYPIAAGVAILTWLIVVSVTKYSSVASLVAGWIYPTALYYYTHPSRPELASALLIPAILVWTHRQNLQRLREGTELKIGEDNNLA